MHIDDNLGLDSHESERQKERWERLRSSLPRLREAAVGEEPLSNVMDLEDDDS